jgi:hypothetical protein
MTESFLIEHHNFMSVVMKVVTNILDVFVRGRACVRSAVEWNFVAILDTLYDIP